MSTQRTMPFSEQTNKKQPQETPSLAELLNIDNQEQFINIYKNFSPKIILNNTSYDIKIHPIIIYKKNINL